MEKAAKQAIRLILGIMAALFLSCIVLGQNVKVKLIIAGREVI